MDFSRLTNPNAYKQALAGLLRRGGEVTDYIEQAPEKAGQSIVEGHERNKALQAQAFANPNRPFQVTDANAMSQLGDRMLAGPLSVAPVGMIAYHGTPHLIKDKFDISKVGTGEGAQSYGYGMYFAENPAVAKQYQAALSDTKYKVGERELKGNEAWAAQFLHNFQGDALPKRVDVNTAISKANETLKDTSTKQEIIDNIKALDKAGLSVENGNFYKVDIPDADIPKMLDYDKPIKDQPEIYELVRSRFTDPDLLKTFETNAASGISGANVYKNYLSGKTDKERSENALALGIKGIRYLDEGSRKSKITSTPITQLDAKIEILKKDIDSGLGNQDVMKQKLKNLEAERARSVDMTSNFVVFEPSTVKLLERNSEPLTRKEILQEQLDKIAK